MVASHYNDIKALNFLALVSDIDTFWEAVFNIDWLWFCLMSEFQLSSAASDTELSPDACPFRSGAQWTFLEIYVPILVAGDTR